MSYMSHLRHHPWGDPSNNIMRSIQIMEPSVLSCLLGPISFPSTLFSNTLKLCISLKIRDIFTTIQNKLYDCSFVHFNLYVSREQTGRQLPIAEVRQGKLSLCLTKHHVMKTYWGSGSMAPWIPDLCTRTRWVVSFTSRQIYPRGNSRNLLKSGT
jgi:hypothetical protein